MLDYISIGNGEERVIFIHGWMMDHSCFDALHPVLDQNGYTYIFIDQRGYGLSRDQDGPYTIVQIAEDVMVLVDHLKWDRFHIVGHSMAGKVISRLIADIPDRIKSAIGITPCPPVKIPFDDQGWALFSKAATDPSSRQEIFRIDTGNRLTDTWYETITEKSMRANTSESVADYLDSWVNYEFFEDVKGSTVPLKIMPAENDPHLTYEVMQDTFGQWFSNTEILKLPNCGHYPMYEIPLLLAAECEKFIKSHSGK
jgi:pimeloyl-ACP methyl ester carboxylesterase